MDETPFLSIDEMDRLLNDDTDRIDRAQRRLQEARRTYEAQVTNAPDSDIIEVREAREASYGSALRAAEAEAEKLARIALTNGRGIHAATAKAQLTLSDEEWARADARRGFVREQCEVLPLHRLVDHLQHAIMKNDRALMYAFAQYIPLRVAAGDRDDAGNGRRSPAEREKRELRRMLGVIGDKLKDPAFGPVNKRALDLIGRAGDLEREAGKRRREEERGQVKYSFQKPGDIDFASDETLK